MNCYNHSNLSAVSQCRLCSKGLCLDCTDKYSVPICSGCAKEETTSQNNIVYKEWAYILIIPLFISKIQHPLMVKDGIGISWWTVYFSLAYIVGAVITGWKAWGKIFPQRTMYMSIILWVIYYWFKICLSLFIGIYLFPFRLIKQLYSIIKRNFL